MNITDVQERQHGVSDEHREVAVEILEKLNALAVEDAVARATRREKDAAGRTRRIGHTVGKMVRQLAFWEGKGALDDHWIHKTTREWFESEAGLTRGQLRVATRVAEEEGLLRTKPGYRPCDRRQTRFYRLDALAVARVVVLAEIENTVSVLDHEARSRRQEALAEKLAELRADHATLERIFAGEYLDDEDEDYLDDFDDEDNEEEEKPWCDEECACDECREYARQHHEWCEDILCEGCKELEPQEWWCPDEGQPAPTDEEAPEESAAEVFWLPHDLETDLEASDGNVAKLATYPGQLSHPTRENNNATLEITSDENTKESSAQQAAAASPKGSAATPLGRKKEDHADEAHLSHEPRRKDDPSDEQFIRRLVDWLDAELRAADDLLYPGQRARYVHDGLAALKTHTREEITYGFERILHLWADYPNVSLGHVLRRPHPSTTTKEAG